MSEIVAVCVVPADGDPGGLLAAGRCGSGEPNPTVPVLAPACCWLTAGPYPVWRAGNPAPWAWVVRALPLWWDGALVPEGWDRARRVFYAHGPAHDVESIKRGPGTNPPLSFVEEVAPWFVECGLASRVVRLARVDGRLVEVSP
jgi:hypothetical protein